MRTTFILSMMLLFFLTLTEVSKASYRYLMAPHADTRRVTAFSTYNDGVLNYKIDLDVQAPVSFVQKELTDFQNWKKLSPLVYASDFDSKLLEMRLLAGVWNYGILSRVQIQKPINESRLPFVISAGDFSGMTGELVFSSLDPKNSRVVLSGSVKGKWAVPEVVLTNGAELGLRFSMYRAISIIENKWNRTQRKK